MANRTTSSKIGAFVIAISLFAVLAVLVLAVRQMFTRPHPYLCLFEGNLNGLRVGAAVKFRGIQIGEVERIDITLVAGEGQIRRTESKHFRHIQSRQFPLPVVFDLDESEIRERGGSGQALQAQELQVLIHEGLRAQLNVENALTGLLYVDLGFHPHTPAILFIQPGTGRYPELPSIHSDMEEVLEKVTEVMDRVEKIDFDSIAASITNTALSVQELAGDPKFRDAVATVNRVVGDPALKRSIDSAKVALGSVNNASLSATRSLSKSDAKLDAAIENLQKSSAELQTALLQMRSTTASAQLLIEPGSPMTHELDAKLDELSDASRWIHNIADYLQRNPSGLIRGADVPR
jgi:paraquat-inducible protein B